MMADRTEDSPTVAQLERIDQLLSSPDIPDDYIESIPAEKFAKLISTKRGAGVLIQMLKKKAGVE